jgi:small conductance mechanosensitive channel
MVSQQPPQQTTADTVAQDTVAQDTTGAAEAVSSNIPPSLSGFRDLLNPSPTPAVNDTSAAGPERIARDVGEFFASVLKYVAEGNWEALQSLIYEGIIRAGGTVLANALEAGIYFFVLFILYRVVDRFIQRVLSHTGNVDAGVQGLLLKSYRVVALTFIGAMVLSALGVNVTALVAGLSIVGIAVGFAARDSLENFIAGVTILIDKPFKVGDYIVVENHYGQVDEITLRSTRIRSVRNEVMVLPNTQMITTQVVNHTKQNTLRVDIDFGIAYKEFPKEAREVVLATLKGDDRILTTPDPSVVVTAMADSSVNMSLRFYLRDPSKEVPIRWEYTEKVREALREADIEIPFPHQQLFIDGADGFRESTLFPKPTSNGSEDE